MDIRPCAPEDLTALDRHWPSGTVHAAHLRAQESGSATFLVAWDGAEPLGSGMVQWSGPAGEAARTAYPGAVEINHLQVRPEHQGAGVGTALIGFAEQLVRDRGRHLVAVGVAVDNPGAERLYTRLGYRRTGVEDVTEYDWVDEQGSTHHAVERDVLLVKDLGADGD